jgi:MFS family permease
VSVTKDSKTSNSAGRVFRGWFIVAAAFTVLFVVYGIQFSFGTFVSDVVEDTGWSETRLQLIFAFYILSYSALSAVSGILTDRFGPRIVVAVGAVVLGAGYLVWANASNLWIVFLGLGIIAPIGMSASWVPCSATVVRWFVVKRGLAIAITTAGGSAANILVPPVAAVLVENYGWRTAVTVLAISGCSVMLLTSLMFRRDPESVGEHPDGIERTVQEVADEGGLTLTQATRTPAFKLLFGMYALTFTVVFVPFVHVNQFAESLGVTRVTAATVISSIGIGGLVGRLVAGPLSDRIDRRRVVVVAFAIETAGFVGLSLAQGLSVLYPAAVAFGFAYGAGVAVFPALVGDYFGRAHAGAIVGRIFATAGAMGAVGPYLAQLLVDSSGSYRVAFVLSAVANAAALALAARLPKPMALY